MNNQRYEKGRAIFEKLHGKHAGEEIVNAFAEISPEMERFTMEWAFHDIMSRNDKLDLKTRELVIIASVTTSGHLPQLKAHVQSALKAGATKTEIIEVILQMVTCAGFPAAVNA